MGAMGRTGKAIAPMGRSYRFSREKGWGSWARPVGDGFPGRAQSRPRGALTGCDGRFALLRPARGRHKLSNYVTFPGIPPKARA